MTLGEKLSRLRRENNYTQEQLADIIGVSRQAISKWESDVAYPETDKLISLSTLFHCSIDYLVREDIQEDHCQVSAPNKKIEKLGKLLIGIVRFAPMELYTMWALLLWAFYAAPLITMSSDNLYQWFGNSILYELQPAIKTLISLGVISCAWIVPLICLQRFASSRVNFIVNLCSLVFQIAVFVCAMCMIGVCRSTGLESGSVVVIVATLTGIFAFLQAVFIWFDYFSSDVKSNSDKPKHRHKVFEWFKLHKVVAVTVACVLVVGVALSVVLPLTIDNTFNINRVSRIKMGDDYDTVMKLLGKPVNYEFSNLSKIVDVEKEDKNLTNNSMYYCSPKVARLIKIVLRMYVEMENLSSLSTTDVQILTAKLNKVKSELNQIAEFEYIKVYFHNGVSEVEYNAKYIITRGNEIKWYTGDYSKQKINVSPSDLYLDSLPENTTFRAQIFYSDGSYRLSQIENVSIVGNYKKGWTLNWRDHWGRYFYTVNESPDRSLAVEYGEIGDNISYIIWNDNYGGYSLTIRGEGALKESDKEVWSKYADKISEINIREGITNVPNNAFENMTNLTYVYLPSTVNTIGAYAFSGCSKLLRVILTKYDHSVWIIRENPESEGTLIETWSSGDIAIKIKGIYCGYIWSKVYREIG